MKIYTKGGDKGETGLYGGARVPKDELRIRAYGTLDELNAVLGMVLAEPGVSQELQLSFRRIQSELFLLGAELATPRGKSLKMDLLDSSPITALENEIDAMEVQMKPLQTFILPGGTKPSALTHFARTVSRRAEREVVSLNRSEPLRPVVMQYLNRLSDYFFVSARFLNFLAQVVDIPWISKATQK